MYVKTWPSLMERKDSVKIWKFWSLSFDLRFPDLSLNLIDYLWGFISVLVVQLLPFSKTKAFILNLWNFHFNYPFVLSFWKVCSIVTFFRNFWSEGCICENRRRRQGESKGKFLFKFWVLDPRGELDWQLSTPEDLNRVVVSFMDDNLL